MKNLSEIIKTQRNMKGLTQTDLAMFAEVNINTIVKIEKDANKTSVETVRKILDVLNMDLVAVPRVDAKSRFMDEHYPHLKESGIGIYILRMIGEIEQQRSMMELSKDKNILKMDFNRLVVRMYDTRLRTEEGQDYFYRALKALPDVTRRMSENHILFWNVVSVDMADDCLVFNCENKRLEKNGLHPIPYLPLDKVGGQPENLDAVNALVGFLKNLPPREKTRMIDLFDIGDEEERCRELYAFFQEKQLDENATAVAVHTFDIHSIRKLL